MFYITAQVYSMISIGNMIDGFLFIKRERPVLDKRWRKLIHPGNYDDVIASPDHQ